MIISELKPWSEILSYLKDEGKIFLVGCKGCAETCHTGGEAEVLEMKRRLEQEGKIITGFSIIDLLCDKALARMRLTPHQIEVKAADSMLIMSCGIGVQAVSALINKVTHPACNTINLGGVQGEWRGDERCQQCGDCVLDLTGGICPLSVCPKGLLNGPCGGSKNGRCEVEPEVRECGWHLIYERLKKLGRLDKMKAIPPLKDYSKMQPPKQLRNTTLWSLER